MLVVVKLPNGEEIGRNNIQRVLFVNNSNGETGCDNLYDTDEITEPVMVVNLANAVAVGMAPDVTEEEYKAMRTYEDELDLKLNAFEQNPN